MLDVLLSLDRSLLLKGVTMLALVAAGGAAVWSALWPEAGFAAPAPVRPKAIKARVSNLPPLPARLEAGSEMRMLTAVLERARDRLSAVHSSTIVASRHIDVAEMALVRLVQEVATVMPAMRPRLAVHGQPDLVAPRVIAPSFARAA